MSARTGLLAAVLLLSACGARERIRAGDEYMEAGRYAAAGRAYSKAVDRRSRSRRALEGAAAAWLADNDPERALIYAQRAADRGDSGAALLAETLIELGRGREAVPLLQDSPDALDRDRWMAEALLSAGQLDAALTAASAATPDEAGEIAGLIGWLSARLDRDEDALSLAHRLRSATSPQARADAAAIMLLLGDEAARDVAATIQPETLTERWLAAAARMQQSGEQEAALRRFMWLWAVAPDDPRATRHAGELLVELGEPAAARRALGISLALDESQSEVWRTLARACHDLEDWRCSAAARSRHLDLIEAPTLEDWLAGARDWRAAGSLPDLIAMWERAVKRQPDQPTLYYHLAGSLMEAGRIDEGVGYARLAWKLVPGDAEVALLLGELYTAREEYVTAAAVYRQAIASNPSDSRLRASLETVLGYIPY
jgi:tetratricopeptide (TPR) repeat protein